MSLEPGDFTIPDARRSLDYGVPFPAQAAAGIGLEVATTAIFGEDGFGFDDLLDVINPLQHVPLVSAIYRHVTGDTIAPGPRLAGGALFGGLPGLAGAAVNLAVETGTGKDVGEHVVAFFTDDAEDADASVQVAGGETEWSPDAELWTLEPSERIALMTARPTPASPVAVAAAAEAAGPNLWTLEPSERIALMTAPPSPPAPVAVAALGEGAPRPPEAHTAALEAAPPAPAPPASPAGRSPSPRPAMPLGPIPGLPAARLSAATMAAIPSLDDGQWLALTRALGAYAANAPTAAAATAALPLQRAP